MAKIFFPPEWYPQDAVMLTWPHLNSDWAYMIDEITECFSQIAHEILKEQKLVVVSPSKQTVINALGEDAKSENLRIIEIDTNDTWARDHAAISVFIDNDPFLYDFTFNGWGLKFAADKDNQINKQLHTSGQVFAENISLLNKKNFVLEGGGIESDGKGTLLTTSECLLSPNRNSYWNKHEIENYLKETFGLQQVLWLDHGYLVGDDTDSHIDTLARFCDENTIAYVKCDNKEDEHFQELQKMEVQLKTFTNLDGKPYNLIELPMANAVYIDGERLPATYANFLIMNNIVLLPIYNSPKDRVAIEQMEKAFPDRRIVGINCFPIIKQHGSLHCVTMQFPKGFIK